MAPYSEPAFSIASPMLFPDTATGSSSPLTVQLENVPEATGPLTVSGISISGSNAADYTQTNNCIGPSIPVGGSCSITITFTPQATGSRVATLTAQTNAPDAPTGIGLNLTGNGVTTVTKYTFSTSVSGPGTITQVPTGTSFANNTTVTLTAVPTPGNLFGRWSGACANSSTPTCTVVVTANTSASVQFNPPDYTVTTSVSGPGTITQSPGGTSFPAVHGDRSDRAAESKRRVCELVGGSMRRQHRGSVRVQPDGEYYSYRDIRWR